MFIVYSALYNGLLVYLCLSAGIAILCFTSTYRKYLRSDTVKEWYFVSFLLIFNSIVKTVFYNNVHWKNGWPHWVSPTFDGLVIFMALWVIYSIIRMKRKC
jgi:hypothetical protein